MNFQNKRLIELHSTRGRKSYNGTSRNLSEATDETPNLPVNSMSHSKDQEPGSTEILNSNNGSQKAVEPSFENHK